MKQCGDQVRGCITTHVISFLLSRKRFHFPDLLVTCPPGHVTSNLTATTFICSFKIQLLRGFLSNSLWEASVSSLFIFSVFYLVSTVSPEPENRFMKAPSTSCQIVEQ